MQCWKIGKTYTKYNVNPSKRVGKERGFSWAGRAAPQNLSWASPSEIPQSSSASPRQNPVHPSSLTCWDPVVDTFHKHCLENFFGHFLFIPFVDMFFGNFL